MTWNLAERSPSLSDCSFLKEFQQQSCDIIALGIQECENIKPRRHEGRRSQKWRELMTKTLQSSVKEGGGYELFAHHKLGGMQLTLFINKKAKELIDGIQTIEVACGIGNLLSNKGGIVMLVRVAGKTIAFVNSHLAAHHNQIKARNENYHRIVETVVEKAHRKWIYSVKPNVKSSSSRSSYSKGSTYSTASSLFQSTAETLLSSISQESPPKKKSGSKISPKPSSKSRVLKTASSLKPRRGKKPSVQSLAKEKAVKPKALSELFDVIFFFGDLNYRIELPRLEIESFCETYATIEEKKFDLTNKKKKEIKVRRKVLSENHPAAKESFIFTNLTLDLADILLYDQLIAQIYSKKAFENFQEGDILFPPSFKYDKGKDIFDTSAKARCPAWTDRILYAVKSLQKPKEKGERTTKKGDQLTHNHVEVNDYYSVDSRSSDHRPVCGIYTALF
eukprot:gene7226-7799_t